VNLQVIFETILDELRSTLAQAEEGAVASLVEAILRADRLFLAGTGRSGFMVRAFAVRLMHLGFTTHVAGETVTPNLAAGDLLLLGSGSGETASLRAMAEKAHKLGAPIALVTASPRSSIGKLADVVVRLPAPTPKGSAVQAPPSVQPMGTLFEQSLLLLLDLVVLRLMERKGVDSQAMFARHANLE
jgi:6-phospho-3-hexuloisomerase